MRITGMDILMLLPVVPPPHPRIQSINQVREDTLRLRELIIFAYVTDIAVMKSDANIKNPDREIERPRSPYMITYKNGQSECHGSDCREISSDSKLMLQHMVETHGW